MNKSLLKIILKDAAMAVAAVIMYSPGLLALTPADPSILRAGCSIMGVLALGYGFIKTNILDAHQTLRIGQVKMESLEEAIYVLENMKSAMLFRKSIDDALRQLHRVETIRKRFHVIVDEKFPPGSLSNDKFNGTAELSINTIIRNCRAMVARIEMFDEKDYFRIKQLVESGQYLHDDIPDDIQLEKYNIYGNNYKAVRDIVNTNESILIKLDALSIEISTMESRDISVENNEIIGEIENLIQETRYYQ